MAWLGWLIRLGSCCCAISSFYVIFQLVDLLLEGDWSTFFADHGSTTSKYNRVNPQVVARLLEK